LSQYLLHILADKKFWDAGGVISLFVLSSTIINLNYVLGLGIFISKKTKYIFIPTMVGGLVNVALCYLLTGPMGIIGAALSSFVGSIVYLVSSYVISQKLYHIEYEIKRGLVVTSVVMAWAGAIYYLEQYTTVSFYEIILVKSALLMLVLSMVFASKLVSINQVRSLLART
jgi:O-antigen/teichoic acid export membrane protein